MDYFQDVVDVELRHRQRKDYFQDAAQLVHQVLALQLMELQEYLLLLGLR